MTDYSDVEGWAALVAEFVNSTMDQHIKAHELDNTADAIEWATRVLNRCIAEARMAAVSRGETPEQANARANALHDAINRRCFPDRWH
jgi:hypothetical protein